MLAFRDTAEAVKFYEGRGYRQQTPPAEVVKEALRLHGAEPVYLVHPSGADIFVIQGRPVAALHRKDGTVRLGERT